MTDVGPLAITARNSEQAEYVVRSRAEQRGVRIHALTVASAGTGVWAVTVTVDDADAATMVDAHLDEDTQVLHLRGHRRRPPSG